jgi:hypothetical protein
MWIFWDLGMDRVRVHIGWGITDGLSGDALKITTFNE